MAGVAGVRAWSVVLVGAASAAFAIAAVALRNRSTPGATWLGLLGAISGVWIGTDVLGVLVPHGGLLVGLEYLHLSFGTVAVATWLLFVLTYTGRIDRLDRRTTRIVLGLFLAVVAVNLSGPLHGLVYADVAVETLGGVAVVKNEPGPLASLQFLFVFGAYPLGLVLLFLTVRAEDRLFTRQALALFVGSVFPYVFGAVDVVDLEPVPWLPMVPVSIVLLGAALTYAVLREELLAAVPATLRLGEAEAFDALGDGVAVLAPDGRILLVNDAACRMFGREREAVHGEPLAALVGARYGDPGDLPTTIERGGRVLEPRHAPVEGATGAVIGHTLLFRDVTEPRRREQRLEVLNRVLRHDLRNAVTVVDLNLELLVDADDRDERAALAASVRSTLDDLEDLGRKAHVVERTADRSDPQRVGLPELLDCVVADVRQRVPGATVAVDAPAEATVVTQRDRLVVALRNVLENALVHAGEDPARATVTVTPADGGVEVAVTDEGPGIPANEIAVLEDGTETPLEHGSGLGLWLVHWAVSSLGGEVTFERAAEGSTVRLWIPEADGD